MHLAFVLLFLIAMAMASSVVPRLDDVMEHSEVIVVVLTGSFQSTVSKKIATGSLSHNILTLSVRKP